MRNAKMETFCIGHHLIDIPNGFTPMTPFSAIFRAKKGHIDASTIDFNVYAVGSTPATFSAMIDKRHGEIVAFRRDNTNILKDVISKGPDSALFRILQIEDSYSSELHMRKDDFYFMARADSYEGHYDEAEADLSAFAQNIVGVKDVSNRPPGFCLGNVVVQGIYEVESTSITFRTDERPDITLTVDIDTYALNEPETLLQRVSGKNSLLEIFDARHKVLRKGDLDVAGMHAQEWLGSVKLGENRDRKQFGFAFETRRPKPGPATPRIHIELDTGQNDRNGKRRENSLTDEQAMVLWDSIIESIRLRTDTTQK